MGGGGTTVSYQQPSDPYGDLLKKFQLEQLQEETRIAKEEKAEKARAAKERVASATQQLDPFKNSIQQQLSRGLLSYQEAQDQLKDYASRYDVGPQTDWQQYLADNPDVKEKYGASDQAAARHYTEFGEKEGRITKAKDPLNSALQELTDYYLKDIQPGQQKSQIESAYQEYLGKGPSEEELGQAQSRFQSGYYKSVGDLKDSLKMSDAYQEKFNQSYLENYYQTMFGKAQKDEKGTKRYQFRLQEAGLPKYTGDLAKQTGVQLPDFKTDFLGTAGEIEANLEAIKDTKAFIYKSGLTNLQGQIDKEVQTLKNEGNRDVAKIGRDANIISSMMSGFWS